MNAIVNAKYYGLILIQIWFFFVRWLRLEPRRGRRRRRWRKRQRGPKPRLRSRKAKRRPTELRSWWSWLGRSRAKTTARWPSTLSIGECRGKLSAVMFMNRIEFDLDGLNKNNHKINKSWFKLKRLWLAVFYSSLAYSPQCALFSKIVLSQVRRSYLVAQCQSSQKFITCIRLRAYE